MFKSFNDLLSCVLKVKMSLMHFDLMMLSILVEKRLVFDKYEEIPLTFQLCGRHHFH